MTEPFRTIEDYELFLYTLADRYAVVLRSTVTLVRRGSTLARVAGELFFAHDIRLVVRERILYRGIPIVIDSYGYEIWRGSDKLYWYDSQPHPYDATLQSTDPHHKHIPPNIKQNRVPAPEMGFARPNIPMLIQEIEDLIHKTVDGG
jgi:hypothetical protein